MPGHEPVACWGRRLVAIVSLFALLGGSATGVFAQPVNGNVEAIGFQANVPSRNVIRAGQWFPILLSVMAQTTEAQEVELQCQFVDADGDQVVYLRRHVTANPDSQRRVWCYAVVPPESAGRPIDVDVVGADGALLTRIALPMHEAISNDTQLVLDISAQRLTLLDRLDSGQNRYYDAAWGTRKLYRPVCRAQLPMRDLPDRWFGLEAVDVVVWDEPDPDQLNIAQLEALIQWVQHGGQLVLGIGPSWNKLQDSVLAEILPLKGSAPPVEVTGLEIFERRFRQTNDRGFKVPISVAVGEPAHNARVTFRDRLPDRSTLNLLAMCDVGSGRVIASAARLRDLAAPELSLKTDELLGEFFDVNRVTDEMNAAEANAMLMSTNVVELYEPLVAQVEFRGLAGARMLLAFAFVAAYILISTFGVWAWLRRRSMMHLNWTAFSACAVVGGVLSLGAVGLTRGVTDAVHNVSFVDMTAGSTEARVTGLYGYKSSVRRRVDITLPGESDYLRPMTVSTRMGANRYATPERYEAVPDDAELENVLMRATLKQFEGCWQGNLTGSVRGELTASRANGRITPESWIQSDLPVEFVGGYLLYIDPRLSERGGVPDRIAGFDRRTDRPDEGNKYYNASVVPPAVNVLAVRVPPLKQGEKIDSLGQRGTEARFNEYGKYESDRTRWEAQIDPDPMQEPMLPTLHRRQIGEWAAAFGFTGTVFGDTLATPDAAGMLASTRDLYLHNSSTTKFETVGRPVTTRGMVDLDVTHWLTRGQAVLLLIAHEPGPAELHMDEQARPNAAGYSYYRIRVPIKYVQSPPRGGA